MGAADDRERALQRREKRNGVIATLIILAVVVGLLVWWNPFGIGGKSGPPAYKTITCHEYAKMVNASDDLTNGALDIASDYLDSTRVDPKGGASDVADFADQIVASCQTATPGTRIIKLRPSVVTVFLARHPKDRS